MDAPLIAAAPSTQNKAKARDPEMHQTRKGNQWYFDMKAHIGVDEGSGLVHVDIKHLPQMADETARRYLFVAIDRATRWVYVRIYADQSEVSSTDFVRRLHAAAPMKIEKLLTDNDSQFTDRFPSKGKKPSGQHAFDRECTLLGIEHRVTPPRDPQTNCMVERFNGRISDVLATTRFRSHDDLQITLERCVKLYNDHLPQKAGAQGLFAGDASVAQGTTRLVCQARV